MADAVKIAITYDDGLIGTFTRQHDGTWTQTGLGAGLAITGYEPKDVMRVLANATETEEIAGG